MFAATKEASECLKIAQHSVCCSQEFFVSPLWQFDQREGSRDGGALLLKAADRHYGLVAGLASCLRDERQAGKVDHSLRELVAQRGFSIACGYPDANDSARLFGDPMHKLLLDRDPIDGLDLAPSRRYRVSRMR
jgi:Transposase DDE domain group 1